MLSIKSFKNIQVLRTQKMIREEMQKEDFFDHLLVKITQELTPTEYQYLINYVIPKKNETRNQKRPIHTNKTVTFENKENNNFYDSNQNQASKSNRLKSYKDIKSACSQQFQRDSKHYFTETIDNVKRSPQFTKTAYSSKSKAKFMNSLTSKKTTKFRFEQMPIRDRETQTINQTSHYKLRKRSKRSTKAIYQNLFTRQNIKRSYNQKFLQSIMKTELFQDQNSKIESFDFNDTAKLRKIDNPFCDFWQKEKEKEENFRNLTSNKFQGSPKASRVGLRIFTRKF